MYKERKNKKTASQSTLRQDVAGGETGVSGNPQRRNTFTSLPSTPPAPVLPLCYSHLPPCSHTVLDSIKLPCKTATSTWCLCMPPPADARLVLRATMFSVHGDNVMEFHLTSGTFMQNREVKGRRRLNCCVTYCLWITSKQKNSPPPP